MEIAKTMLKTKIIFFLTSLLLIPTASAAQSTLDVENLTSDITNSNIISAPKPDNSIKSLMFDNDEEIEVSKAIESLKNNQVYVPQASTEEKQEKDLAAEEKAKKENAEKLAVDNAKSYIYLASIIYFSKNEWAIWINNDKITSETNSESKELYITSIEKDKVEITWTMNLSKWKILAGQKNPDVSVNSKNQVVTTFSLQPNQTFILGNNSTVEGKASPNQSSTTLDPAKLNKKIASN